MSDGAIADELLAGSGSAESCQAETMASPPLARPAMGTKSDSARSISSLPVTGGGRGAEFFHSVAQCCVGDGRATETTETPSTACMVSVTAVPCPHRPQDGGAGGAQRRGPSDAKGGAADVPVIEVTPLGGTVALLRGALAECRCGALGKHSRRKRGGKKGRPRAAGVPAHSRRKTTGKKSQTPCPRVPQRASTARAQRGSAAATGASGRPAKARHLRTLRRASAVKKSRCPPMLGVRMPRREDESQLLVVALKGDSEPQLSLRLDSTEGARRLADLAAFFSKGTAARCSAESVSKFRVLSKDGDTRASLPPLAHDRASRASSTISFSSLDIGSTWSSASSPRSSRSSMTPPSSPPLLVGADGALACRKTASWSTDDGEVKPTPRPREPATLDASDLTLDDLPPAPPVTCAAYAVYDSSGTRLLGGSRIVEPLQIGSVAKVVTALVVLNAADRGIVSLHDRVAVTRRAQNVGGTTASLQTSDVLSLWDLLHGMMLPSGNDAATAIAEHVGQRLAVPQATGWLPHSSGPHYAGDWVRVDPISRFVAGMQTLCDRIGMSKTAVRNPHGLQHDEHSCCARDVATLSARALSDPRLSAIAATSEYECKVQSLSFGQRKTRTLRWRNTNKLLGSTIDGVRFTGLKTGITPAAGGCLVTSAHVDGVGGPHDAEIVVVTLGSSSAASRFNDNSALALWGADVLRRESDA